MRIGYVSPDFRDQVVGRNILPLLRERNREFFQVFCYANIVRSDDLTGELRSYADVWRNIAAVSDDEVAETIRADRVDILVDLSLHMARNRLLVFARKPAPVQVTFAGYPGGTGLETMDYRLTDVYLDPPGMGDDDYREQSIRLPHSFWCYDPKAMTLGMASEPEVSQLPALKQGVVTFGCLGNFCKVNNDVMDLWARVLRAADRSRLLLLCHEGRHRQIVRERLQQHGIESGRIDFAPPCSRNDYLNLYHRVDIGLDPFPYNGHTTSLDSFWMGVPVVTLGGQTVVGRAGVSQLRNLRLTEFLASDAEEYVRIAASFASNLERLAQLRRELRERMRQSPLCDAVGFTQGIKAAFRGMWRKWCEPEIQAR